MNSHEGRPSFQNLRLAIRVIFSLAVVQLLVLIVIQLWPYLLPIPRFYEDVARLHRNVYAPGTELMWNLVPEAWGPSAVPSAYAIVLPGLLLYSVVLGVLAALVMGMTRLKR